MRPEPWILSTASKPKRSSILREAYRASAKPCMLWSIGKDSTALLWMARKAFLGRVPFPMVLLETFMELPEVYAFRDELIEQWQLDFFAQVCPPEAEVDQTLPPATRAAARKTEGLRTMLREQKFDAVIVGIRRDEQAMRAKERVFSPRRIDGTWDVKEQPPEFWGYYTTSVPDGAHLRVHPLLSWTELDIWEYTLREEDPVSCRSTSRTTASATVRWGEEHHAADRQQRRHDRGDHRRAARDARCRARRPHDGPRERSLVRTPARRRVHVAWTCA